jgi:hypothetical protein
MDEKKTNEAEEQKELSPEELEAAAGGRVLVQTIGPTDTRPGYGHVKDPFHPERDFSGGVKITFGQG